MKKIFTIVSALLIVTGLKAQKTGVQKETIKPAADTLLQKSAVKNNAVKSFKGEAKVAPTLKYTPAIKKAATTNQQQFKGATLQQ